MIAGENGETGEGHVCVGRGGTVESVLMETARQKDICVLP